MLYIPKLTFVANLIHCGAPFVASGVIIEHFTDAYSGALITYHCEESDTLFTAVCGNNGEWDPDPALLKCEKTILGRLYTSTSL